MIKSMDDKIQFRIEIAIALIVTAMACSAGLFHLLVAPNDLYPLTSDAMGHMAKVQFLAESLSEGEFPSWFPFWYNGSTVAQYYPPFSYWIMVPILLFTKNIMLTYKIYCFLMIFTGGVGVWYFCRKYIGNWCGLFASVMFCVQPYILLNFLNAGLIAQGPVIALASWYLFAMISFSIKPSGKKFLICTLLCAVLILSHPMTIFMICLCLLVTFIIFTMLKKVTFQIFFYLFLSIVFAGTITAFWSLVGATGLETPGIPYLLVEAALNYTANTSWFISLKSNFFYFAIPVTIGCIFALILLLYRLSKKSACTEERYQMLFCTILTFFTILFSFGLRLPLFRYLPLAESYVPGRILVLTSASGAILLAYFIYGVIQSVRTARTRVKYFTIFTSLIIVLVSIYYMYPFDHPFSTIGDEGFGKMISYNKDTGTHFDKGRYGYISAVESSETFFPIMYDFNIIDGWNIEGTPHNQEIWNYIIANSCGNYDYLAKSIAYKNVRYLLLANEYERVRDVLNEKYSFDLVTERPAGKFYASENESSYFFVDNRNALVLGPGSPGIAMEFPYLVWERRNNIFDYSLEELEKYKLIYLCEPSVNNLHEKDKMERILQTLVNAGITVVIEPVATKDIPIFDVTSADIKLEDQPVIISESDSPTGEPLGTIDVDAKLEYGRVLFGLDEVFYQLIQNNNRLKNDVIGTKKVGDGEVIFVGMHLSQYLKAVYARNWGTPDSVLGYPSCSGEVKKLFTDLFATYGVNKDFWPKTVPIMDADWNEKGVSFDYSSPKAQELTVSVTYTPRWKASIDGKPVSVGQRENLVTLELPAGRHKVIMRYGLTKYGIAGYGISIMGLVLLILFIKFYDIIFINFTKYYVRLCKYLEIKMVE